MFKSTVIPQSVLRFIHRINKIQIQTVANEWFMKSSLINHVIKYSCPKINYNSSKELLLKDSFPKLFDVKYLSSVLIYPEIK